RLRHLEPAHRAHGRGDDPAHAGGAPDDQRRADPALRADAGRDLVPDRPRRGHEHVRAPERKRHGGRLVRAPAAPPRRRRDHVDARSSEGYNRTYGIVHPMEQWLSNREVRLSPFYPRERELGAVFYETAGWERPWWYASNEPLLEEYGDRVMPRDAEWESRWW